MINNKQGCFIQPCFKTITVMNEQEILRYAKALRKILKRNKNHKLPYFNICWAIRKLYESEITYYNLGGDVVKEISPFYTTELKQCLYELYKKQCFNKLIIPNHVGSFWWPSDQSASLNEAYNYRLDFLKEVIKSLEPKRPNLFRRAMNILKNSYYGIQH